MIKGGGRGGEAERRGREREEECGVMRPVER